MSSPSAALPIACIPESIPIELREPHFALARQLFEEAALSYATLTDGYQIRFPVEVLPSVAQFVTNERLCCPFMRFEIEVPPGADALLLRMTGPAGTREVLDAELRRQCASSGCNCHVA